MYGRLSDVETLYQKELKSKKTADTFGKWLDARAYKICSENGWHSMDLHEWFAAKDALLQGDRRRWMELHRDMATRVHVKSVGIVPSWVHQQFQALFANIESDDQRKACLAWMLGWCFGRLR